jgi:hypothetical protein
MAKRNDKHSIAEDYISQVEWESKHQVDRTGHAPWKDSPDWKYKRVYGTKKGNPASLKIFWISLLSATIGYIVYDLLVLHTEKGVAVGIIILVLEAMFFVIGREQK